MELLSVLEAAARSGVLALFLSLGAVGYQTRELRRVRDESKREEEECRARVDHLENALREVYTWARSHTGGKRRARLPAFTELQGATVEHVVQDAP